METFRDDLGHPVDRAEPPSRVVSLVPSLTEAIAASCPERLVGATEWCVRPVGLAVTRVRGTKNPDRAAIAALEPDLVVANQEENRAADVERLRSAGIPVWVTVTESVAGTLASLQRLFTEALAVPLPAWLAEAKATWNRPAPPPWATAVVPIWRDPWMVVGDRTYASDLLRLIGIDNVFARFHKGGEGPAMRDPGSRGGGDEAVGDDPGGSRTSRYPRVDLAELRAGRADVVILPDEPYPFTEDDGPEAFPGIPTALVSGRHLTWYGPAMLEAEGRLRAAIVRARPASGP